MSDSCILATVKCSGSFDLRRMNIDKEQLFQIFMDVQYCDCNQELTTTSEKEKQLIVVKYCKNLPPTSPLVEGKTLLIINDKEGYYRLIIDCRCKSGDEFSWFKIKYSTVLILY